jgi:hypothetical protein
MDFLSLALHLQVLADLRMKEISDAYGCLKSSAPHGALINRHPMGDGNHRHLAVP